MGLIARYNERIRNRLEFEGVPENVIRMHYDIMCDNVWAAIDGSVISDGLPFSRDDPREIKYLGYLFEQSQRRAEKLFERFSRGFIDTVLG